VVVRVGGGVLNARETARAVAHAHATLLDLTLIRRRQTLKLASTRKIKSHKHADAVDRLPSVDILRLTDKFNIKIALILTRSNQKCLGSSARDVKGEKSASHKPVALA
jgi:hypothetical protein